jgi:hypothetical protein
MKNGSKKEKSSIPSETETSATIEVVVISLLLALNTDGKFLFGSPKASRNTKL